MPRAICQDWINILIKIIAIVTTAFVTLSGAASRMESNMFYASIHDRCVKLTYFVSEGRYDIIKEVFHSIVFNVIKGSVYILYLDVCTSMLLILMDNIL